MSDPYAEALGQVQDAVKLMGYLPYLKAEIDTMCKAVETRVFTQITSGTLTDEAAKASWMEIYAAKQILRRFQTRITVGQSAGERVKGAL